jgi:hypothetical protein
MIGKKIKISNIGSNETREPRFHVISKDKLVIDIILLFFLTGLALMLQVASMPQGQPFLWAYEEIDDIVIAKAGFNLRSSILISIGLGVSFSMSRKSKRYGNMI